MSKNNISFRSMVVLTAMKAFIRNGDYSRNAETNAKNGSKDVRLDTCKQLVDTCYQIADLADAEGKKRHAAEQVKS